METIVELFRCLFILGAFVASMIVVLVPSR